MSLSLTREDVALLAGVMTLFAGLYAAGFAHVDGRLDSLESRLMTATAYIDGRRVELESRVRAMEQALHSHELDNERWRPVYPPAWRPR